VREVIETAEAATRREFGVVEGARRAGDPPRLVADASCARKELGWQTRYSDLERIIITAWNCMTERHAVSQIA
jgi:UDP-glucose 4-epimerase